MKERTVHYLGPVHHSERDFLRNVDEDFCPDGRRTTHFVGSYPPDALGSFYTRDAEKVTCRKCLDRMAERTEVEVA